MKAHLLKKLLLILMVLASVCTANVAQAQIGWTLAQCRKHFGHEIQEDGSPLLDDPTARTFGIKYRPHEEHHRGFDGRLLFVGFDPDGTVGKIKWWKFGSEFSDQEIEQLLKKASAVSWHPVPGSPGKTWLTEDIQDGPTQWVGEQNGKIIFEANEGDTQTGGWILTITTRTAY
jgi:hypothetical protein